MTSTNPETTADDETITLEPRKDEHGRTVYVDPRSDLISDSSGILRNHGGSPVSTLPRERLAGDETPAAWRDIYKALKDAEDAGEGVSTGTDVVMPAGGALVVTEHGKERPASVLPTETMAGLNPEPSIADVGEVEQIDPQRIEKWTPVSSGLLNGWKFRLRPEDAAGEYVFLAFRNPADGNRYRVFVVSPKVDDWYGHDDHMNRIVVGGQVVPVVCGPKMKPAADNLAEARAHAGKWMHYHYAVFVLGLSAPFSA